MEQEKTYYSQEELQEFREIIEKKLSKARKNYDFLVSSMESNDITDTTPTFKNISESATLLSRHESAQQAAEQLKFIKNLEAALVRIENGTYGVCRATGKLIPKELL